MKTIITITIATLQLLLSACATSKPKTNTSIPSLDTSKEMTRHLRSSIQDAKDGIHRARTLNERIDYKASVIQ